MSSNKRRQHVQFQKESSELDIMEGDDRHGPVDVPETASSSVLATRKMAVPKSRRTQASGGMDGGTPIPPSPSSAPANPFSGFGTPVQPTTTTDSATSSTSGPFSFLAPSSLTASTNTAAAATATSKPSSFGSTFSFTSPSISNNAAPAPKVSALAFSPAAASAPPAQPSSTANASVSTAPDTKAAPFGSTFSFTSPSVSNTTVSAPRVVSSAPDLASPLTVSVNPTEYVKFLKIRALNDNLKQQIIKALEIDPLADLTEITEKYVSYFGGIASEAVKAAIERDEFANLQADEPAKASAPPAASMPSFSFGATTKPAAASSSFSFGTAPAPTETPKPVPVSTMKPAAPSSLFSFSAAPTTTETSKTAQVATSGNTTVAIDDSDTDSDDDIKIEGPAFVAGADLLKETDSPFVFGPGNSANSKGPLHGPSFSFSSSSTTTKTPFKFSTPTPAAPISAPTASTPTPTTDGPTNAATNSDKPMLPFPGIDTKPPTAESPMKFSGFGTKTAPSGASPFGFTAPASESSATKPTSPFKFNVQGSPFSFSAPSTSDSISAPFKFNSPAPSKPATPTESTTSTPVPAPAPAPASVPSFNFSLPKPIATPSSPGPAPTLPSFNFGTSGASNVWTPDKPIKFGSPSSAADSTEKSTESPSVKPLISPFGGFNNPLGSLKPVGSASQSLPPPSVGFSFLGSGTSTTTTGPSAFSLSGGFSGSTAGNSSSSTSSLFSAAAAGKISTPTPSVAPATAAAPTAQTPSQESVANGDAMPLEAQINLSEEKGPGEEDEDVKFNGRARVYQYKSAEEKKAEALNDEGKSGEFKSGFEGIGVGPLRILHNPKTSKSRIIVRSDGVGRILLNVWLRKNQTYTAQASSIRILDFQEGGKAVTYSLKVKQDQAEEIARIMNEQRPK
ncbi:uncharacterized protein V1518DRAFT_444673 [Limtongia smithiae]|uniref:uncharacterized protein n=1 Tax=Limtongia smithiae TaxID=1125753 RepID=UPI0034CD9478